ncbi:MAG: prolipoprotein diacylglyceryl transferase [Chromatiales bacterium]|nr:prolipoprotein diacylglyceryl transferase [Chromatiales bacterium]
MLQYSGFDPIALQLGPVAIRWYGLMYLFGFAAAWFLMRRRASRPGAVVPVEKVDDLLFYVAIGVIIGGRLGYMLFYNFSQVVADPLSLLRIWQGGMSFHGGFLGVAVATWLFTRKLGCTWWQLNDFVAPMACLGLAAGRIGNFINGELWGRPGSVPWAMQVDCTNQRFFDLCFDQLKLPRGTVWTPPLHPSPLYEAMLEGFLLFAVIWIFSSRPRPVQSVTGVFLLGYGLSRFSVEMVRLPDSHIDYLAFGWVTMGQVLTLPMIVGGILLLWLAYRRQAGT